MIRIGFYTYPVMLSSELPDVGIFTDHDYIDFRLSSAGRTLLAERYYALGGVVNVCDIASIVEQYMSGIADLNLSEFSIEAFVGEDETDHTEVSFRVLYCDRDLSLGDPSQFLLQNFLTLTSCRRVAPENNIEVQWYAADREGISLRVYATYLDGEGRRGTYLYVHSGNGMMQHGDGIIREIIDLPTVAARAKSAYKLDSLTLLSVTIRCGERMLTVYADPSLTGIAPFTYTNCFNEVEQLAVQCVTTYKIKVDRSLANLGRTSQFYDVSTSKEYEMQTAPLTTDECRQLEQMLASPQVRLPVGQNCDWRETDFGAMRGILITDFTCELSDSDEKPNTAKFTWRFESNRPRHDITSDLGTFDNHFNPVFT